MTNEPTPGPTPGPSPHPGPYPPPPPAPGPDIGVSTSWLRKRAEDCDDSSDRIRKLCGPAKDAFGDLRRAAPEWGFLDSIPEMERRWEDLNKLLRDRLGESAQNFRDCADNHDENESSMAASFNRLFGIGGR